MNSWKYKFEGAKAQMEATNFRSVYKNNWPKYVVTSLGVPVSHDWTPWYDKSLCWCENNRRLIRKQVNEYGNRHGLIYYGCKIIERALRVTYVSKDAPMPYSDKEDFENHYLYFVFFPIVEIMEGHGLSIKLHTPLYAPIPGRAANAVYLRDSVGHPFHDPLFQIDRPWWNEENLREIFEKTRLILDKYNFAPIGVSVDSAIMSGRDVDRFSVWSHNKRTGRHMDIDFSIKRVDKGEQNGYLSNGPIYELGECLATFPEDTAFPWCETKLNSHGFPIYHIGGGKYVSQEFINEWFPANDKCRKEEAKCLYETMDDGSARVTMMNRSWSQPTWQRFAVKEETYNEYQECSEFDLWETGRWDPHSDGESMDKCLENALRSLDKMGCAMIGELRLERIQNPWGTHTHVWKVDTIDKYTGKRYRTLECEIRTPKNCGSFGMKYHLPGFGLSYDLRRMGALTPEEQHQQRLQEVAENKEPVIEEESTTEISENACKWWFDAHYDDLEELEANIDEERCFRIPATMLVGVSRPAMFKALGNLAYKYDAINGQADGSILIHVAEPVSDDDIELLAEFEGNDQGLADYIASNVNCD